MAYRRQEAPALRYVMKPTPATAPLHSMTTVSRSASAGTPRSASSRRSSRIKAIASARLFRARRRVVLDPSSSLPAPFAHLCGSPASGHKALHRRTNSLVIFAPDAAGDLESRKASATVAVADLVLKTVAQTVSRPIWGSGSRPQALRLPLWGPKRSRKLCRGRFKPADGVRKRCRGPFWRLGSTMAFMD
jgi:hypothetical protein